MLQSDREANNQNVYGQSAVHKNVSKKQATKGISVGESVFQSMEYKSRKNPNVKVTLEFTGAVEKEAMEKEITGVLMEKYLEKVLQGSMQNGIQALISSPLEKKGGKLNE